MKKALTAVVVVVLLCCIPAAYAVSFQNDYEAIDRAAQSVFLLEVYDGQDRLLGTGSRLAALAPNYRMTEMQSMIGLCELKRFDSWNLKNRLRNGKYLIKELGKQLKKIGMLVVQDQVWNRVTVNRAEHKSTRYYIDEFHLLLKEEQTASYSVEIWKRFRKWGGIPTGLTQNVKDLLASREIENIFENSDFIYMLNQAGGDRQILAKQLNISPHQLSYVTHSGEGEGLLFYGSVILPFVDRFPKDTELYRIMTTKPQEMIQEEAV